VSDLLTLADMGAALGLTPAYVRDKIVKRADFPRPTLALYIGAAVGKKKPAQFPGGLLG
jgi:hypothetical protein